MRESNGNTDVVAPSSAPMLPIVPLPVALMDSAPGPKYSMILLVPPFTVRRVQREVMTSFGAVQPASLPVRCTPTSLGWSTSHGRPAITSPQSAPPTPIASIPSPAPFGVCEAAREGVVLEDDLVDDPRARPPEADAVLLRHRAEEVVHLLVLPDRAPQVVGGARLGADQVVAVHGRGHRHARAPRLHELQQGHLRRRVLHRDPVHGEAQDRPAALPRLALEVPAVGDQDLLGPRQPPAPPPPPPPHPPPPP